MGTPEKDNSWLLTEKEKQTLRLIVRGHDAKSIARKVDLSVHTINERLRDARRKMSVSSSREAARILLDHEGGEGGPPTPELSVDAEIGEDVSCHLSDQGATSNTGAGWAHRHPLIILGVCIMILALGLLALTALPQVTTAPSAPVVASEASNPEVIDAARQWLVLLDQSKWDETYRATGSAFRKLNTLQVWSSISEKVRAPLGAPISRTFLSQENLPAPPAGYEVVKFRTQFAKKPDAVETVTLDREDGKWRVVGVTVG